MDKNKSMYPKNQPLLCLFYFLPLLEYKPLLEMYSPAEMSNINEGAYQKYSHPIRHQGILLATSLKNIFVYWCYKIVPNKTMESFFRGEISLRNRKRRYILQTFGNSSPYHPTPDLSYHDFFNFP